jgi:hypothetical protein
MRTKGYIFITIALTNVKKIVSLTSRTSVELAIHVKLYSYSMTKKIKLVF